MPRNPTRVAVQNNIRFDCPCGYVYDQPIKDGRRLKLIAKLHGKICSVADDIKNIDDIIRQTRDRSFKELCKKAIVL